MSDTMSQGQIDQLVKNLLPPGAIPTIDPAPICPKCNALTKRMVFNTNFPIRVRVAGVSGNTEFRGKIPANAIFCFGCGSFFDSIDRNPVRERYIAPRFF